MGIGRDSIRRASAGFLCALFLVGCSRSALSLAERFSELDIPNTAEVVEFRDEASGLVGEDLWVRIVLRLDASDFRDVMAQAETMGYGAIPIRESRTNELGMLPAAAAGTLGEAQAGRFRYVKESASSWTVIVLDQNRSVMIVERVIL